MKFDSIMQKDFQKMYKNGITPLYEYESFDQETNEYKHLTIVKTADEVLEENKNKQSKPQPSETERLQKQLLETQALVANLQEQILLKQNGGIK